jgi:hypothetical protein
MNAYLGDLYVKSAGTVCPIQRVIVRVIRASQTLSRSVVIPRRGQRVYPADTRPINLRQRVPGSAPERAVRGLSPAVEPGLPVPVSWAGACSRLVRLWTA